MNRIIRQHGFCEMIFDHEAACELHSMLDEAIIALEKNRDKALIIGCLKQENVHSSVGPGVYSARIKCIVGSDVDFLIPEIKTWSSEELERDIQRFMRNFEI